MEERLRSAIGAVLVPLTVCFALGVQAAGVGPEHAEAHALNPPTAAASMARDGSGCSRGMVARNEPAVRSFARHTGLDPSTLGAHLNAGCEAVAARKIGVEDQ